MIENARCHNWFRHGSGPPTRISRRLQTLATRAVDLGLCNPAIPELRRYITFAVSDCINAVSTLLYHLLYRRWLVALGVGRWFAVFAAVSAVSAAVSVLYYDTSILLYRRSSGSRVALGLVTGLSAYRVGSELLIQPKYPS